MKAADKPGWTAVVDRTRCTLCEVCVARCPTGALSLSHEKGSASLLFKPALCNGCGGAVPCQTSCPERALMMERAARPHAERVEVLAQGDLARCGDCGTFFAPLQKLAVPRRKAGAKRRKEAVERCPSCRRARLMRNILP